MILKLKYFGMIAEAVGVSEESFNFSGTSIKDLELELTNCYSKLNDLNYNFALNQAMAERDDLLNENDEIALLPPFAGG